MSWLPWDNVGAFSMILSLPASGTVAPQSGAVDWSGLTSHQGCAVLTSVPGSCLHRPGAWRGMGAHRLESLPVPKSDSSNRAEGSLPEHAKCYPARIAQSEVTALDADTHTGKMNPEPHRQQTGKGRRQGKARHWGNPSQPYVLCDGLYRINPKQMPTTRHWNPQSLNSLTALRE